jgi:hypothetical protein
MKPFTNLLLCFALLCGVFLLNVGSVEADIRDFNNYYQLENKHTSILIIFKNN